MNPKLPKTRNTVPLPTKKTRLHQESSASVASENVTATKEIIFRLAAACARNVLLAADFTEWKKSPIQMTKGAGNLWHLKVALPPGKYRYQFLVDLDLERHPANGRIVPLPFGTMQGVAEVVV